MKHIIKLISATLALSLGACSVYHPQAVDIPLINHAGDTRLDVAAGVSTWLLPDVVTFGGTVSYGVTDWLAVQGHVNYGGENIYFQAAPGAYLPLGEHGVLEGYVGYGVGSSWHDGSTTGSDPDTASAYYAYSGHFSLPFLQANIGLHDLGRAHIDLAFGLKGGAYMPDFRYDRYTAEGEPISSSAVTYSSPNLLVEPQLQFRIGGEQVKYCLRLSFSWLSDLTRNGGERFTADFFTISNGLTFSF